VSEIEIASEFRENTISCPSCEKKLINYALVAPNEPVVHSFIISCPFCKGKTDCIKIKGLISMGPIGSDQSYPTTILDEYLDENEIWHIELGK